MTCHQEGSFFAGYQNWPGWKARLFGHASIQPGLSARHVDLKDQVPCLQSPFGLTSPNKLLFSMVMAQSGLKHPATPFNIFKHLYYPEFGGRPFLPPYVPLIQLLYAHHAQGCSTSNPFDLLSGESPAFPQPQSAP